MQGVIIKNKPYETTEYYLNPTAYMHDAADPFMISVNPSSVGYFQQVDVPILILAINRMIFSEITYTTKYNCFRR